MRLVCGDCYETLDDLEKGSFDLVITDPPYRIESSGGGIYVSLEGGVDNKYGRKHASSIERLDKLGCLEFAPTELLEALRKKMDRFYGYFFCNKTLVPEYLDFAVANKMSFEILVMGKTAPIPARNNHFLPDTEYCVMIRQGGTYFASDCTFDDYRKVYMVSRIRDRVHPAQKPVEFLERMVRVSCPKGGTVLDPFMGSGSTGVACVRNGREFIGVERDPEFFKAAEERIAREDPRSQRGLFDGLEDSPADA